jgi:hypothetical protein
MRSVKLFLLQLLSFILKDFKDFKVFKVFKDILLMFLDDKNLPFIQIPTHQRILGHEKKVSPF